MKTYVILETGREGYAPSQLRRTLTVGQLIGLLEDYDEDTPIIFSNDNGYTYGSIYNDSVREYEDDDEDEEEDEEYEG